MGRAFNPHRIPPPKGPTEIVEEIRTESASAAVIVRVDVDEKTIFVHGCLGDRLLMRHEAKKHGWKVESST